MKSFCIIRLACNALKSVLGYSTIVVVVNPTVVLPTPTIVDDNSTCPISFVDAAETWSVLKSVFNILRSWSLLNTSIG